MGGRVKGGDRESERRRQRQRGRICITTQLNIFLREIYPAEQ